MNVLILSVGRRVELIQSFKAAREELGIDSKIVAVDMKKTAPALYHADYFSTIPVVNDANYTSSLKSICKEYNISLVIPTIDTELPILSEKKEEFAELGVKILISDQNVIETTQDKVNTYQFFKDNNIDTPEIITEDNIKSGEYEFPLFIKPRDGSSSQNTFKVNNDQELEFFKDYVPNPIILNYIDGEEYTIDAFVDFDGNPITIIPRVRVDTRGGETAKGKIVQDEAIISEVKRIIDILEPVGPITVQCIKTETSIKFIEINPRYGGGAPISITAGANTPEYVYKLLNEEKLEVKKDFKEGLVALRYDQAVFLSDSGEVVKK